MPSHSPADPPQPRRFLISRAQLANFMAALQLIYASPDPAILREVRSDGLLVLETRRVWANVRVAPELADQLMAPYALPQE